MTTYEGSQLADLHRPRQKPALFAETPGQACEASIRQMSKAPFQHYTHIPDGRYTSSRPHPSEEDRRQRQMAVPNPPYLTQEHPRYVLPYNRPHEPTMMHTASHQRAYGTGQTWDHKNDSKYRYPPTTIGSLAQYNIQRPNASRDLEYAEPGSSYYDASNRSRSSVGSIGRRDEVDSQYSSSSTTFPSPVHSEKSPVSYSTLPLPNYQNHVPAHQRQPTASMPSGFENLLHHHVPSPSPPPPRRTPCFSRCRLSIRQQPLAARACGAGDRDRRAVDPPPIIQLLITDFDSSSKDVSNLQDPRFTVGCLLYPVQESLLKNRHDTSDGPDHDTTSLLSGKAFVSPFYVDEEPDPSTAPAHPSTSGNSMNSPRTLARQSRSGEPPASFFIFSDLSVRTAGLYRLQFRLMNWGAVEDIGQSLPILAEVWSEPFRVYPAKDFPGMRDSSLLTLRLKELGFLELKTRGKGMGKGRRVGDRRARQE